MPAKKHSLDGAPDDDAGQLSKIARTDAGGPEADSYGVPKKNKNRAAGASRTGQACDRCKTRKIRCDDTEEGCMPCRQNNTECRTTDRITRRATVRGHTEALERDNLILRQHAYELEQQMRDAGLEPKQVSQYVAAARNGPYSAGSWPPGQAGDWEHNNGSQNGDTSTIADDHKHENNLFALPTFRPGCNGDNYLGVSVADDSISPIKGTSLSVFGMQIDLADFVPHGVDDPDSMMSYHSLVNSIRGQGPSATIGIKAELPSTYEKCLEYTNMYFAALNPWFPLLHRPHVLELIAKLYQGYQPTTAENVIVHMLLANVKYQIATRNANGPSSPHGELMQESMQHYHHAASFRFDLSLSRTIEDIIAMAMMCAHLRNFPKPGPAWIVTSWTFSVALEMGIHRSAKAWAAEGQKLDVLEIELRKRLFWTLLSILVVASGKLGRPMPIRSEDYDVELPEPLNDNLVPAEGGTGPDQCYYHGSIEVFKMTELFLETYATVYAIKRGPEDYETTVRKLEARAKIWKDGLPSLLSPESLNSADSGSKLYALALQAWSSEYQLLLHHPALCRSIDPEFIKRNLGICIDSASTLIEATKQLWMRDSLDGTWSNAVTFIAAIFTLLFASWERRGQISTADLNKLREQMDICCDVLGEFGLMLGSGPRLRDSIQQIINDGLGRLSRYSAEKTASAAVASSLKHSPRTSPSQLKTPSSVVLDTRVNGFSNDAHIQQQSLSQTSPSTAQHQVQAYTDTTDPALQLHAHQSPSAYAAAAAAAASSNAYQPVGTAPTPQDVPHYGPGSAPAYVVTGGQAGGHGHGHTHYAGQPDAFMYSSGVPNGGVVTGPGAFQDPASAAAAHAAAAAEAAAAAQQAAGQGFGGPTAWRQWIDSAKDALQPHEYMNSASALMAMGGGNGGPNGNGGGGAHDVATGGQGDGVQHFGGGGGGGGGGGQPGQAGEGHGDGLGAGKTSPHAWPSSVLDGLGQGQGPGGRR